MKKYTLEIKNILADNCFSEIGKPTGLYWNRDKSLLAVASTFNWLQWAGRDLNTKLKFRYRVSIYDLETLNLVKIFDDIRYPINHIDFHPDNSILAIATGSYDGGYCFEGELLFWDIEYDRSYSHLREKREVTTCKFSDDGGSLFFVLRPPYEEDEEGNSLMDSYYTYETHDYFEKVYTEVLNEIKMNSVGIKEPYTTQDFTLINKTLNQLANERGLTYDSRWHVWDINMLNEAEIISTSNVNFAERWSINGERIDAVIAQDNAKSIEIVNASAKDYCLINVEQRNSDNLIDRSSVIYKWDFKTGTFDEVIKREFPISISINKNGEMLAREVFRYPKDKENTLDFIIENNFNTSSALNLGHYDTINHYLRVNGTDSFYFIQGTPASSHKKKWICRLNAHSNEYSRLFPMEWDTERNSHMLSDGGCYCKDTKGEALIIASKFYTPNPSGLAKKCSTLIRRKLPNGEVLWSQSFDSQITSVVWLEDYSLIAFALTEGKVGIISSIDGEIVHIEDVKINGVDSIIMSMSNCHDKLVAGTIDGRIISYQLVSN